MNIAREPIKLTYEEYKLLPEDKRAELIGGDLLVTPAPNVEHQRIIKRIFVALNQWVEEHQLGEVFIAPTDVILSKYDVVQPDIFFVAKARIGIVRENFIEGPPDLIIEILSKRTEKRDKSIKSYLYSKYGVREYWIVDPVSQTITVSVYESDRLHFKQAYPISSNIESPLLPGLKLLTRAIFSKK